MASFFFLLSYIILLKNSFKINSFKPFDEKYQIILEPYKRKWIPSLDNSRLTDQSIKIAEDPFNQTFISLDPIDTKKQLEFQKYDIEYQIGKPLN